MSAAAAVCVSPAASRAALMAAGAGLSGIAGSVQNERVAHAGSQHDGAKLGINLGLVSEPEALGIRNALKEGCGFFAGRGVGDQSLFVGHVSLSLGFGGQPLDPHNLGRGDGKAGVDRADGDAALVGVVNSDPSETVVTGVLKFRLDENALASGDGHFVSPAYPSCMHALRGMVKGKNA